MCVCVCVCVCVFLLVCTYENWELMKRMYHYNGLMSDKTTTVIDIPVTNAIQYFQYMEAELQTMACG